MEFSHTIRTTQVDKNPIHTGHPSPAKILLYSCGMDRPDRLLYLYHTGWPGLSCREVDLDIGVKAARIIQIGRGWPGNGSVRTIQVGPYYDSDIGVKAVRMIRIGQGWPGQGSIRTIQVGQDWPLGTMTQILGWRPPVSYGLAGGDLEREVSVQYRSAMIVP